MNVLAVHDLATKIGKKGSEGAVQGRVRGNDATGGAAVVQDLDLVKEDEAGAAEVRVVIVEETETENARLEAADRATKAAKGGDREKIATTQDEAGIYLSVFTVCLVFS